MSKVHYSPYADGDESYAERAMCGVIVGENYQYDNRWANVSCKMCIKNRIKIEGCAKSIEEDAVNQLGDMAEFIKKDAE
jgi:hypothetical protein